MLLSCFTGQRVDMQQPDLISMLCHPALPEHIIDDLKTPSSESAFFDLPAVLLTSHLLLIPDRCASRVTRQVCWEQALSLACFLGLVWFGGQSYRDSAIFAHSYALLAARDNTWCTR